MTITAIVFSSVTGTHFHLHMDMKNLANNCHNVRKYSPNYKKLRKRLRKRRRRKINMARGAIDHDFGSAKTADTNKNHNNNDCSPQDYDDNSNNMKNCYQEFQSKPLEVPLRHESVHRNKTNISNSLRVGDNDLVHDLPFKFLHRVERDLLVSIERGRHRLYTTHNKIYTNRKKESENCLRKSKQSSKIDNCDKESIYKNNRYRNVRVKNDLQYRDYSEHASSDSDFLNDYILRVSSSSAILEGSVALGARGLVGQFALDSRPTCLNRLALALVPAAAIVSQCMVMEERLSGNKFDNAKKKIEGEQQEKIEDNFNASMKQEKIDTNGGINGSGGGDATAVAKDESVANEEEARRYDYKNHSDSRSMILLVNDAIDVIAAATFVWGIAADKVIQNAHSIAVSNVKNETMMYCEERVFVPNVENGKVSVWMSFLRLSLKYISLHRALLLAALIAEGLDPILDSALPFNEVAYAYARQGKWEEAVSVRDYMRELCNAGNDNYFHNNHIYDVNHNDVSDSNSRTSDEEFRIMSKFVDPQIIEDAILITNLSSVRVWRSHSLNRNNLFNSRPRPNIKTYNALIIGANKSGYPQLSQHYYRHDMPADMVKPDVILANRVFDGFSFSGDAQAANIFYKHCIEHDKIVPNIVTFNILLKIGLTIKDSEQQLLFGKMIMKRMASYDLLPDGTTFLALCALFVRAGCDIEKCFELKDRMIQHFEDSQEKLNENIATKNLRRKDSLLKIFGHKQYTALINACAINLQPDRAMTVHQEMMSMMERYGRTPANNIDAVNALLKAMIRSHQYCRGADIGFQMIHNDGLIPDWRTAVQLIYCAGKAGRVRGMFYEI